MAMRRFEALLWVSALTAPVALPAAAAEPVMVQCGQQYQAAKVAGTLNGADWNTYRAECAARLKAQPTAAAPAAQPAPVVAAVPGVAAPVAMSSPSPAAPAPTGGRAAMLSREKQCGAEWRAQKASLVTQTPGLTWPRYWSQCNTRLKAAVH